MIVAAICQVPGGALVDGLWLADDAGTLFALLAFSLAGFCALALICVLPETRPSWLAARPAALLASPIVELT